MPKLLIVATKSTGVSSVQEGYIFDGKPVYVQIPGAELSLYRSIGRGLTWKEFWVMHDHVVEAGKLAMKVSPPRLPNGRFKRRTE